MDLVYTVSRKQSNVSGNQLQHFESLNNGESLCSVSSKNIVAFTTTTLLNDTTGSSWGCHVYVADLNTPWLPNRVTSNRYNVTALEWDLAGENLLFADTSGVVQIWTLKNHVLNDWCCLGTGCFQGEVILSAVFFHNGKKIALVNDKKDSFQYNEKFNHLRFAPSVRHFGGRPLEGCLVVSATGMVGVIVLARDSTSVVLQCSSESLGSMRNRITSADICYGKNGQFLVAVTSGNIRLPIQCYRVSVKKVDDKCNITSQALPSFFLQNTSNKELHSKRVVGLRFVLREDTDSLVVAVSGESGSQVEIWELREKTLSVHKLFSTKPTTEPLKTVLWQHQCQFKNAHQIQCITTSKLSLTTQMPPSSYIIVAYSDGSIICLLRETLKQVSTVNINNALRNDDCTISKQARVSVNICKMDMSWLGNVLLCSDTNGQMFLYRLLPISEPGGSITVPYVCTLLEYCLVSGLDWWDVLLCLRSTMLEAVCEKFNESFNRQNQSMKQFYNSQFLSIKTSLYRMSTTGQSKASDLTCLLMLFSIATAFKSLLRPSDMTSHDKGPAESLATVMTENLADVDKVLFHLEAKEFTVEPSTLQSLQQLIQWVADLALNLLTRLSEQRWTSTKSSGYQLIRDYQALNTLRELLVIIRIWGLLRQSCLPVFVRSADNLDVLALLFKLLSRLVLNTEPDDSLLDECCLLPNQVMIPPLSNNQSTAQVASPALFVQNLPIQMEYNIEPEILEFVPEVIQNEITSQSQQIIDSFKYIHLGKQPLAVKLCSRCGSKAQVTSSSRRTAAIIAWDQRWTRSCRCSGLWRNHYFYTTNNPSNNTGADNLHNTSFNSF